VDAMCFPMPDAPPVTATTLPSSFNQSAILISSFRNPSALPFLFLLVCFCLFSFADLILVKRGPSFNSDKFLPRGNPLVQEISGAWKKGGLRRPGKKEKEAAALKNLSVQPPLIGQLNY
jgi:hypothetical protein